MTYSLLLSPEAEKDILAILEYTQKTWGVQQAEAYLELLEKGLDCIQDTPYIGRDRPDISPRHRSFPIAKHIAVYFVEGNTVFLSRMIHHSRDIYRSGL